MVLLSYYYYSAKLLNYVHLIEVFICFGRQFSGLFASIYASVPVGNGSLKGRGVEGVGGETLLLDVA